MRRSLRLQAAFVALAVCSIASGMAAATVYVTADNGTTNIFGTLDVATGQFNEIGTTDPLFYALTTGATGQLFGADLNSGHLFTISKSGATAQYGSSTAPDMFQGLAYSKSAGNQIGEGVAVAAHALDGRVAIRETSRGLPGSSRATM